jgi:hypothetical protein
MRMVGRVAALLISVARIVSLLCLCRALLLDYCTQTSRLTAARIDSTPSEFWTPYGAPRSEARHCHALASLKSAAASRALRVAISLDV